MAYFVRYTMNPAADTERNYSFVGYQLFETREEAIQFHSEFEEVDEDEIAQDNVTGMWGMARNGLCGFGEFETIEDAEDFESEQYGMMDKHIFEGERVNDNSQDDGICFKAERIVR